MPQTKQPESENVPTVMLADEVPENPEDRLIHFGAAARLVPGAVDPSCLRRWADRGVLDRVTGERVKLREVRRPGKRFTNRRWLREFLAATGWSTTSPVEHAKKQLRKAGI